MPPLLLIGLILLAVVAGVIVWFRRRSNALRAACMSVFIGAYARTEEKPQFYMAYGYGLPIFRITHKSKEAHARSESSGANGAFSAGIQKVCGELASRNNPYQASRAIYFAWAAVGNEVFYPNQKPSGDASEA